MIKNQNTSSTPSMESQFREVSTMVEEIQTALSQRPGSAPPRVYEQLNKLYDTLGRLRKQSTNLEGEWRSLVGMVEVSQAMNSTLELDQVLQIVMDTIIHLTGAERGFLMLRDHEGDMVIRVARNWEQESLDPSEFAISRTVINRAANDGQPVLTTNAQEDPRFGGQQSVVAYSLRSILCVPLKLKNSVIGVIYADNRIKSGLFTQRHLDSLAAFANQAAMAIDNARLFVSVRRTLAEVTELKNLMDNVFSSIASGVVTIDMHENIVLCNRAAENILGRMTQDVVGRSLDEVMTSISSALRLYMDGVVHRDATVTGLEVTSDFSNRGTLDLRLNLSPLKDVQQNTQGVAIVMEDLTEKKKLEAQRRLFERMVSPAVISQLNPDSLQLGGKRTQITTLFADIRGFTHFSESLSPEELVSILNCYLKVSAEAVLGEEGTIDKFMGDAIMALFNAPIPQSDHTLRAVRAALAMRAAIHGLHNTLPVQHHLNFGAGIHVGEAVLGLIGTEKRLDYTAIGDSVNTAKRIQENAGPGQILISQPAYLQVADYIVVKSVDPITAKGKTAPVAVYEILNLKSE